MGSEYPVSKDKFEDMLKNTEGQQFIYSNIGTYVQEYLQNEGITFDLEKEIKKKIAKITKASISKFNLKTEEDIINDINNNQNVNIVSTNLDANQRDLIIKELEQDKNLKNIAIQRRIYYTMNNTKLLNNIYNLGNLYNFIVDKKQQELNGMSNDYIETMIQSSLGHQKILPSRRNNSKTLIDNYRDMYTDRLAKLIKQLFNFVNKNERQFGWTDTVNYPIIRVLRDAIVKANNELKQENNIIGTFHKISGVNEEEFKNRQGGLIVVDKAFDILAPIITRMSSHLVEIANYNVQAQVQRQTLTDQLLIYVKGVLDNYKNPINKGFGQEKKLLDKFKELKKRLVGDSPLNISNNYQYTLVNNGLTPIAQSKLEKMNIITQCCLTSIVDPQKGCTNINEIKNNLKQVNHNVETINISGELEYYCKLKGNVPQNNVNINSIIESNLLINIGANEPLEVKTDLPIKDTQKAKHPYSAATIAKNLLTIIKSNQDKTILYKELLQECLKKTLGDFGQELEALKYGYVYFANDTASAVRYMYLREILYNTNGQAVGWGGYCSKDNTYYIDCQGKYYSGNANNPIIGGILDSTKIGKKNNIYNINLTLEQYITLINLLSFDILHDFYDFTKGSRVFSDENARIANSLVGGERNNPKNRTAKGRKIMGTQPRRSERIKEQRQQRRQQLQQSRGFIETNDIDNPIEDILSTDELNIFEQNQDGLIDQLNQELDVAIENRINIIREDSEYFHEINRDIIEVEPMIAQTMFELSQEPRLQGQENIAAGTLVDMSNAPMDQSGGYVKKKKRRTKKKKKMTTKKKNYQYKQKKKKQQKKKSKKSKKKSKKSQKSLKKSLKKV